MIPRFRFLLLLLLPFLALACGDSSKETAKATPTGANAATSRTYPYKVAATTGMVADIVRNVAGDKAAITEIIGAGVDPHMYKPTRSDVITLRAADIVFYSGLHLEGQMTEVLGALSGKPVVAVTEGIPEDQIFKLQGAHDPHVWMDPGRWSLAAEEGLKALITFDPANEAYYRANAEKYLAEMAKLDEYAKRVIATIPKERRVMITAHDAFNYFGDAFDLEVLGVQGISTESDAGLQDINHLVDLIVERKVQAVFVESSVPDKNVRALVEGATSRGHKITVGGSLFSDAMGKAGTYEGTYIGMIDHNVTLIVHALGGEAPERGMNGTLRVEKSP